MKQLHDIQLAILKKLLFAPHLRYSELKPEEPAMDNNKYDFHLNKMIDVGYIAKDDNGYFLTTEGKEYANRMDTDAVKIIRQAKIGASVCPIRKNADGEWEILIYKRLKQPFYGCQGFMSGKVPYGESIVEGARRELKEETNLEGSPEVVFIVHFIVTEPGTGKVIEDKILNFCRVLDPTGNLQANDEGEFMWIRESEIDEIVTQPFGSLDEFKEQVDKILNFDGTVHFREIVHEAENF